MFFQYDVGIKNFLSQESGLPVNDVIIASNSWSFRERIKQKGSLVFPYMSYRIQNSQPTLPDRTFPRNFWSTNYGYFDSEIQDRVVCYPFFAKYECVFWSVGFVNTVAVFEKFYDSNFTDNLINYNYIFSKTDGSLITYQMQAPIEFLGIELDPNWEAAQDIEKGKLHSIDLSFVISGFHFSGQGVVPVNEIIIENFYNNQPYDSASIPGDATLDKTKTTPVVTE